MVGGGFMNDSAYILNLKTEGVKCNANSTNQFLLKDNVALENGEDFLCAHSGSFGNLIFRGTKH
jgi:hypothetical protein